MVFISICVIFLGVRMYVHLLPLSCPNPHIGCLKQCGYSFHIIRYPELVSPNKKSQNRFSVFLIILPLSIIWTDTILFSSSIHAVFSASLIRDHPPFLFSTTYRSVVCTLKTKRPCPGRHSRVALQTGSYLTKGVAVKLSISVFLFPFIQKHSIFRVPKSPDNNSLFLV